MLFITVQLTWGQVWVCLTLLISRTHVLIFPLDNFWWLFLLKRWNCFKILESLCEFLRYFFYQIGNHQLACYILFFSLARLNFITVCLLAFGFQTVASFWNHHPKNLSIKEKKERRTLLQKVTFIPTWLGGLDHIVMLKTIKPLFCLRNFEELQTLHRDIFPMFDFFFPLIFLLIYFMPTELLLV